MPTSVDVPVPGHNGAIGALRVGWLARDVAVAAPRALLAEAARPISMAVRAGLSTARDEVEHALDGFGSEQDRRHAFLEVVRAATGAGNATAVLPSSDGHAAVVVSTGAPSMCAGAVVDGELKCPVLAAGHGQVLAGPRRAWPASCRRMIPSTAAPCCIPLRTAGRLGGLVLDYGATPPAPLTRDLVPLLTMASAGAARLAPAVVPAQPGTTAGARADLELRCFGRFEVRLHGRTLPAAAFRRHKALTLLKILVLARSTPVRREVLVQRLWPGADAKAANNRLYGVVHALRSAIEPQPDARRWTYVCKDAESYYFDQLSPHWVDVQEFRRLASSAGAAEQQGRTQEAMSRLEAALQLYRGDLFSEQPADESCILERAKLRRQCLGVVTRLAELRIAAGEPESGVDCLRRGLALDPLREDLHQALIQTLADLGRRKDALAQYRACERVLREELDIGPLPATRRLERLLRGRPS